MKIKEAGKLYLDGKLKFYDLVTMKKVDWYFALDNSDQCVMKMDRDWWRFEVVNGFWGTRLKFYRY